MNEPLKRRAPPRQPPTHLRSSLSLISFHSYTCFRRLTIDDPMSSARPVRPASAPPAARQARIGAFGGFHPQNTQPRFSSRLLPRASPSSELLPIFPLGMVALPASQCPLHIFEARYRVLFRYVSGSDQGRLGRLGRLAALARSLARIHGHRPRSRLLPHPLPSFLPSFLPHRQHVAGRGRG